MILLPPVFRESLGKVNGGGALQALTSVSDARIPPECRSLALALCEELDSARTHAIWMEFCAGMLAPQPTAVFVCGQRVPFEWVITGSLVGTGSTGVMEEMAIEFADTIPPLFEAGELRASPTLVPSTHSWRDIFPETPAWQDRYGYLFSARNADELKVVSGVVTAPMPQGAPLSRAQLCILELGHEIFAAQLIRIAAIHDRHPV